MLKFYFMKRFLCSTGAWLFCLFGFFSHSQAQMTITLDSTLLEVDTVIDGLDIPWEIAYGPDGWIWTTERKGIISRIHPDDGTKEVLLDLDSIVFQNGESGLLGLALHPDFLVHPYVYVVYTYTTLSNIQERMERYRYNGTALVDPFPIIENIPGNNTHDGSRLYVLEDSTLIMTTGDAQDLALPQDISSMNGKVLRFNLDGTIPDDNPFPGSPVFSWGHRNAQGIWQHNGIIYSSEHGPFNDDEFQILKSGRNYGWPAVEGYCDQNSEMAFCSDSNVVEPLAVWTPTIAPSDIIYYDSPNIPEWENTILMTVLKDKKLVRFEFDGTGTTVTNETHYLTDIFGRLRDITVDPKGCVYLATNGSSWVNNNPNSHEIIRLCPKSFVGIHNATASGTFIRAMPHPATDQVTLQFSKNLMGGRWKMYNLTGHVVANGQVTGERLVYPRNGLAAGAYIIKAESAMAGTQMVFGFR